MTAFEINTEYNKLSSKYNFSTVKSAKVSFEFAEIDEFIDSLNTSLPKVSVIDLRDKARNKFIIAKRYIYLKQELYEILKNANIGEVISKDINYTINSLQKIIYKYIYTNIYGVKDYKKKDNIIMNDLHELSKKSHSSKNADVANFINKWTTQTKNIMIDM